MAKTDPTDRLPAMRQAIREVDPSQPVAELRTFDEALWESVSRPWFFLVLMGIFAALALLLASLGLYGVLAFSVAQRRREMGIRVALGARAQSVRSLVLGEGLRLAAIGTALGVGTARPTPLLTCLRASGQPREPTRCQARPSRRGNTAPGR